jgi:hypothetical protein
MALAQPESMGRAVVRLLLRLALRLTGALIGVALLNALLFTAGTPLLILALINCFVLPGALIGAFHSATEF